MPPETPLEANEELDAGLHHREFGDGPGLEADVADAPSVNADSRRDFLQKYKSDIQLALRALEALATSQLSHIGARKPRNVTRNMSMVEKASGGSSKVMFVLWKNPSRIGTAGKCY